MVKQDVSQNFSGRPSACGLVLPRVLWAGSALVRNTLSFVPANALVLTYSDGGN
jgi:hypothetical protein